MSYFPIFCIIVHLLSGALANIKVKDEVRSADQVRYDNYTVYRTFPRTNTDAKFLAEMFETGLYDFWTEDIIVGKNVDIMVAPKLKPKFKETMDQHHLKYEVWIENVQVLIDNHMANAMVDKYKNYTIYRVFPTTEKHAVLIDQLKEHPEYHFKTSTCLIGRCDVMVGPFDKVKFTSLLAKSELSWVVLIDNVQQFLLSLRKKPKEKVVMERF